MQTKKTVASILSGILVLGLELPVLAQTWPTSNGTSSVQTLPPPPGEGWRTVNPQPLTPGQSQFNLQSTLLLQSGDLVSATYQSLDSLYIAPGESRPFSLPLDQPLRDTRGNVVVPAGAILEGQFQPVSGGTQFFSRSILINGQSYPFFAQSGVFTNQKDPRQTSGGAIAGDAVAGAAAGALLGGLLGNRVISTEKVLGGALAGAVVGNVTAPQVAVIKPGTLLNLTMTQDFQPVLN